MERAAIDAGGPYVSPRSVIPGSIRLLWVALLTLMADPAAARTFDHVIHISVDGLHGDAIEVLGSQQTPSLHRLIDGGAYTLNARTDAVFTNTLPNHASQLTGRSVLGGRGHRWIVNSDPGPSVTIHSLNGDYVASVLDVVHDAGRTTAMYAGKSKFAVFDRSWNESNGAPDRDGVDDGRDKIDSYHLSADLSALMGRFLDDFDQRPASYVLLHLREPDTTGHSANWDLTPGSAYLNAVERVDDQLGRLLDFLDARPGLAARTAVILTADHGGEPGTNNHLPGNLGSARIPFIVFAPGVRRGDLYALNPETTRDPGDSLPSVDAATQPVRNGDAANLALLLLGLPPVPGSTIANVRLDDRAAGDARARKTQRQKGDRVRVKVKITGYEPLVAGLRGKFRLDSGYRIKARSTTLAAGETRKLKLRPRRKRHERKIIMALDNGERIKTRIKVRFTDAGGHTDTETLYVRLRR